MIRAKRTTATGQPLPDIFVDLSQTEAGLRIFRKLSLVKSQGFTDQHLADINAGTINFTVLEKVFSRDEIIAGLHGRLAKVAPHSDEYKELWSLLHDLSGWKTATGGQVTAGVNRYDVPRGSRRDTFGGGASRGEGNEPESKASLKKSMDREGRLDECKAHGLRVHSGSGDPYVLVHPKRPGHGELHLQASGDWEHRRRGKVLASGGPAQLRGRLAMFSKDED